MTQGEKRDYTETLRTLEAIKQATSLTAKKALTSKTGISPSGFGGWRNHPEMDPHRDIPNDLLHNLRLGFAPIGIAATVTLLQPKDVSSLTSWLKSLCLSVLLSFFLSIFIFINIIIILGHDFSGFSQCFSSEFSHWSKFNGREYGILCQIMPLALRSIRASRDAILAWCIIAEITVFLYSPVHRRSEIPQQQIIVRCLHCFSFISSC